MPEILPYLIGAALAVVAAVVFFFVGSAHRRKTAESTIGSAEDEARRILSDAMKNAEQKKKEAYAKFEKQLEKDAKALQKEKARIKELIKKLDGKIVDKETGKEQKAICSIGDEAVNINGELISFEYIVNHAREYVKKLGGFEKLAEWGLR